DFPGFDLGRQFSDGEGEECCIWHQRGPPACAHKRRADCPPKNDHVCPQCKQSHGEKQCLKGTRCGSFLKTEASPRHQLTSAAGSGTLRRWWGKHPGKPRSSSLSTLLLEEDR